MNAPSSITVTVAYGDGEFPETMEAALMVLREAAAPLTIDSIEIGSRIYAMDYPQGILPSAFKKLDHSKLLLKGHVSVPENTPCRDAGEIVREHYGLLGEHCLLLQVAGYEATAHINDRFALFEPKEASVHSVLLAWIMVLEHVGLSELADRLHRALEEAIHEGLPQAPLAKRLFGEKKSDALRLAEAVIVKLALLPAS